MRDRAGELGRGFEQRRLVLEAKDSTGIVEREQGPEAAIDADGPASLGLPALSCPSGFTTAGVPIGLQIVGAPFAESTALALAHAYRREREWHKKPPKLDLA